MCSFFSLKKTAAAAAVAALILPFTHAASGPAGPAEPVLLPMPVFVPPTLGVPSIPRPVDPVLTPKPAEPVLLPMPVFVPPTLGVPSFVPPTLGVPSIPRPPVFGAQAQAVGERSTAIGAQAAAVGNDSIALGTQATAIQGIAIGTRAISESVSSVAIGQGARAVSSVAVGTRALAAGVRSVAVGDGATATGASAVALGDGAAAIGASAVALGAGTVAERDGTVSVGGRQIVGVADGTQPGDAVTVRQLESALAGSQVSEKIDGLRSDLQSTERRVSAGVAMALAMSQPVSIAPGDTSAFTAAAGNFNGQSALAIGVHHTPIPGLLYSAGLGITTGSSRPAIRVGFSLSF